MNTLSSRKAYTPEKVVGCISLIFLLFVFLFVPCIILLSVILFIPYISVAIAAALFIILLWLNRSELPVNNFKAALVGLTACVAPLFCTVLYPVLAALKYQDNYILIVWVNITSLIISATILISILALIIILNRIFDHIMEGSQDHKESEVSATNDLGFRKNEIIRMSDMVE